MFFVDCEEIDLFYMLNIWMNGSIVGEIMLLVYGFCVEVCVVFGMVCLDLVDVGIKLEVDVFGKWYLVMVQFDGLLWDL